MILSLCCSVSFFMKRTYRHKLWLGARITLRVLINGHAGTLQSGYPLYLYDSLSKPQARLKKSWRVRHPKSYGVEGFENLLETGEVEQ